MCYQIQRVCHLALRNWSSSTSLLAHSPICIPVTLSSANPAAFRPPPCLSCMCAASTALVPIICLPTGDEEDSKGSVKETRQSAREATWCKHFLPRQCCSGNGPAKQSTVCIPSFPLLGTGTGTITCPLSSCTRVASAVFVLEGPALYRGLLRNSCPSRWASGCEGLEIIHCACTWLACPLLPWPRAPSRAASVLRLSSAPLPLAAALGRLGIITRDNVSSCSAYIVYRRETYI